MAERPSVLFLCTGNSARSQMAEALAAARVGDRTEVLSAGTEPAPEVNPLAVAVMAERGLDLSGHRPKTLDEVAAARAGRPITLIVTVCRHANETCPAWPGAGRQIHVGFDDPAAATGTEAERLAVFRRVADEIEAALDGVLAKLGQ